jgi:hypothetical protein
MDQFRDKLKEGRVYMIESFMIIGPRPNYRAIDHYHRFRISQNTKISEILPELENFPPYAYDAKSFDDIRPRVDKAVLLSGFFLQTNHILHATLYVYAYTVSSFVSNFQMLLEWLCYQMSFHQRQGINQEDTFT